MTLHDLSEVIDTDYDLERLSPKVRRAFEARRKEARSMGQLNAFNSYAFVGESEEGESIGSVTLEKAD